MLIIAIKLIKYIKSINKIFNIINCNLKIVHSGKLYESLETEMMLLLNYLNHITNENRLIPESFIKIKEIYNLLFKAFHNND